MSDFKLLGKCFSCKRNRLFIRKRYIQIKAIGQPIKSRELFCTSCFKALLIAKERGTLN